MIQLKSHFKKENILLTGSIIAAFLSMFIFFYVCHPIVILDADDWQYVSYTRLPIPYTGYWNPSRILPEILMSLCGSAALLIFHTGLLGYVESQVLVFGIVVSLFIAVYTGAFIVWIRKKFSLSTLNSCILGALFLSLHFLIFRKTAENNTYMFYSYDTCCYFYYTISALLSCTLVMIFDTSGILEHFFSKEKILIKIILVIVIYFAVFSNLFNSIILVAYLGVSFLNRFFLMLKRKESFLPLLKKNAMLLAVILLWLAAVYCEGHGGRAGYGYSWDTSNFVSDILLDARYFLGILASFSIPFYVLFLLAAAGVILLILQKADDTNSRRELFRFIMTQFAAAAVIVVFLILLCARVNSGYMLRPQVMFGYIFSLFAIVIAAFAYIIKFWKPTTVYAIVLLLASLILCNTAGTTYSPSNPMGLSEKVCISVDNDLIAQMIAADESGEDKVTIYVMNTGVDDNWPHTAYVGYGLKQTLLKHGIIHREFGIIPEMSTEFNERNGIQITFFWPRQFRAFYPTLF